MVEASECVVELCEAILVVKKEHEEVYLEKLDLFSRDIKYVEQLFMDEGVDNFSSGWNVPMSEGGFDDEYSFDCRIIWDKEKGKIMHFFSEDDEPETLLGCSKGIRFSALDHFHEFLTEGVKHYTN